MGLDEAYRSTPEVFGTEPERVLSDYYHRLDRKRSVLDIGAGQGRHGVFLARKGFMVDAVETAAVALEAVTAIAERESLPIRTWQTKFQDFESETRCYGGILLFGIIQMLSWKDISDLIGKVDRWTESGALAFATAFTTEDPSFENCVREWGTVGRNSFESSSGEIRTFLEPGEILRLFEGYSTLHRWEGIGPEHRHGDGRLHRHGIVEAVFRK